MILFTAHYSIRDPDRLDITRAGCDRLIAAGKLAPGLAFAPSRELLRNGLRWRAESCGNEDDSRAAWERYAALYHREMVASHRRYRDAWDALLRRDRVVAVCFCSGEDAAQRRCHRFLLAGYLDRLGAEYRGEIGGAP